MAAGVPGIRAAAAGPPRCRRRQSRTVAAGLRLRNRTADIGLNRQSCRPAPANPGCGCRPAPAPAPAKPDCGCQSMPVKPDCGCRPMPAPAKPDCGHRPAPSRPDCGCDHMHPSAAGIDSFEIAMAYVPWQRWKGTYDPHRSLMSGTIFPELDKPFCAAGRCSR